MTAEGFCKKAVIYARYSSDKQTEQSIEGQLYDCYNYAKAHNIEVVGEYIDRAMTGRNDDRPNFQQMLTDSAAKAWEYVLVWKFDRFSRNMYDSVAHKRTLQKNGVRVLSVMENVTPDNNGQLMEHILESFADYYISDLREKTIRGMRQTAMKCESTGHIPLGYKSVNKKLVIDEETRYIPETVFSMYAAGERLADIAEFINSKGYRTRSGKKFTVNSFYSMLTNEKYIGIYRYNDIVKEGGIPAMIPVETFEKVRERMKENRKRAAKFTAKAEYILSGKLFCGHCGEPMSGMSGRSRNGTVHYYYRCSGVAKKSGCDKHNERKELIEAEVCRAARAAFDELDMDKTAETLHEMYVKIVSGDALPAIEKDIADVTKQIENIVNAIAQSGGNQILIDKLNELTERKDQLESEYRVTKNMSDNVPSLEQLKILVNDIVNTNVDTLEGQKTIIDIMISKVFVYDDKLTVVFLGPDGKTKDISLKDIEEGSSEDVRCLDALGSQSGHIRTIYGVVYVTMLRTAK